MRYITKTATVAGAAIGIMLLAPAANGSTGPIDASGYINHIDAAPTGPTDPTGPIGPIALGGSNKLPVEGISILPSQPENPILPTG